MSNNIVPHRPAGALTRHDTKRLQLFTKTVGKDLVGEEINEALEWCEMYGANPMVRDIYFFCFGKYGTDARRVVPVLGIGLYRKIAARTGNYRPDDQPPRFGYGAEKTPQNPTGMEWCEVSVFMHSHGEWHRITSRIKWEERAPLKELWEDGAPTGRFVLDPKKKNWHTMPETMMAKCTEVDAIRKAWPNETSGSYVEEEMDAVKTIELTATEVLQQADTEEKLAKIGGRDALIVDWCDGGTLGRIPLAEFFDASLRWMAAKDRTADQIEHWLKRNALVRGEVKAKRGSDYLDWQKAVEQRLSYLRDRDVVQGEGQ
jgi:phage recombination protein Bet